MTASTIIVIGTSAGGLDALTRLIAQLPKDFAAPITSTATLHGRELLKNGLTVAQVVNGYGDVCQVVTQLASEADGAISVQDFHIFNRSLDEAIAGAVTAYGSQRETNLAFTRQGSDRSGLGLGLSIALNAARANSGDLQVRDIPGTGCVFTVDLPRQPARKASRAVGA